MLSEFEQNVRINSASGSNGEVFCTGGLPSALMSDMSTGVSSAGGPGAGSHGSQVICVDQQGSIPHSGMCQSVSVFYKTCAGLRPGGSDGLWAVSILVPRPDGTSGCPAALQPCVCVPAGQEPAPAPLRGLSPIHRGPDCRVRYRQQVGPNSLRFIWTLMLVSACIRDCSG